MKPLRILLALATIFAAGCATKVYDPNGNVLLSTRADAAEFHFIGPGTELQASGLNHSQHTKAAMNGATSAVTAIGAAAAGIR